MAEDWMPGAKKIPSSNTAPTDKQYPAKAIPHITWDRNATAAKPADIVPFSALESYFSTGGGKGSAPHILWDPFTGECTQFFPASSRSLSLVDNASGTRTNRAGAVVIQIEALFFPYCRVNGKVYPKLTDTPCAGWAELNAWVKSHGVVDSWPMGKPNGTSQRSEAIWVSKGGWYGHSQVPENTHTDPISWPDFVITSPVTKPPTKSPVAAPVFPGRDKFVVGANNKYVTEVDKNLVRLKFTHYSANGVGKYSPGPQYTTYTKENVAAFQRSRGWSGSDADGLVGPQTWHDLFTL